MEEDKKISAPLKYNWKLWEHYQHYPRETNKKKGQAEFVMNKESIMTITDLVAFGQMWNTLKYKNPSHFFWEGCTEGSKGLMYSFNYLELNEILRNGLWKLFLFLRRI